MALDQTVKELTKVINSKDDHKTSPYDTSAEVKRVENGVAYVHIPGGVDETPAKLTMNAKPGDSVMVRISGGMAWLIGNSTNPPTDDSRANEAAGIATEAGNTASAAYSTANEAGAAAIAAYQAAESAQSSADSAATAAANAWNRAGEAEEAAQAAQTSADNAATAASNAQTSADNAATAASNAQTSADNALASAQSANRSANNALMGLSTLENVVDTVNWFADHKKASTDTTVNPNKTYYIFNEQTGTLSAITPEGNENPSAEGWYELDEAISNYVAAHVATTADGLSVVGLSNGWRVLISSGTGAYAAGVFLIDPNGVIAQATTGNGITFDQTTPFYIGDSNAYIIFDGNGHINMSSGVTIGNTKTLQEMLDDLGASLKSVEYGIGNSSSSHADISSWSSATPTWEEGKYVWMRTTTNGLTYTYTCIQGAKGENGSAGRVYMVESSETIIVVDADGTPNPISVTFNSYYRDGANPRLAYPCIFVLEETTDGENWTEVYRSSSAESSTTYYIYDLLVNDMDLSITTDEGSKIYVNPDDFASLRCRIYDTSNNLLDQQTLPVIGAAATLSVVLTNETISLTAENDGASVYTDCYTDVRTFFGTAEVTHTASYSVSASSGVAGSWNSTTKRYEVLDMSTDNGYVDITALYSGISLTKRFTISKSIKGDTGEDGNDALVSVSKSGNQTTITATSGDGTVSTATIDDGASPTVSKSGNTVTITDAEGNTVTVTDGTDGQSIKGDDGDDAYLHIAWANSSDGTVDFSTTVATDKQYMGTYTDHTQADAGTPSSYKWVKIKGEQGIQGIQGIQGETGNGISTVTITYGKSSAEATQPSSWGSSVPSLSKGDWLWIKTVTAYTDSSSKTTYTKSYIGTDGKDGISVYVKSATKTDGVTTVVLEDSDGHTSSLTIEDGTDGTNGTPGANGYVHTAWANSADGSVDFSTSVSTDKQYLGVYTDNTPADSTTYSDYSWSKIKGEKGETGAAGNGIASITYHYAVTTTQTAPAAASITSTTIPTLSTENKYLWQKQTIKYSTTGTADKVTVALIGVYGDQGIQGEQGIQGIQGIQGVQGEQGIKGDTGDTGNGISSITYYYATTTDQTTPAASAVTGTTIPTMSDTNKYLWQKEVIAYTNGTNKTTVLLIAVYGDKGDDGAAAYSYSLIVSTAAVQKSEAGAYTPSSITLTAKRGQGTTTAPANYTGRLVVETTTNGTSWTSRYNANAATYTYTVPSGITAIRCSLYLYGGTTTLLDQQIVPIVSDGASGISVSSVTEYYLATSASSGVTKDTSGWTTSIQTMDATNQYLWNYEVVTGSDGSTLNTTTPVIIGRYGQNGSPGSTGNGITGIVEWYQISASDSTPPATPTQAGTGYSSSPVATTEAKPYLWNYEVISYTFGNPTITDARVIGTHGEAGADAYTVLLTNESHTFAGGTSAALAGTATSKVVAYKGATQVACYAGSSASATSISTGVTGLTCAISNNNSTNVTLTFTAATELTTKNGTVSIPIVVDGKSFTKLFTFSLSLNGKSPTVSKTGDTVTITDADGNTVTVTDGENGAPGVDGDDSYLHIAWASSPDGTNDFSTTVATGKTYMGTYTDHTEADSTNPADYDWVKTQGESGISFSISYSVTGTSITFTAHVYQNDADITSAQYPADFTWSYKKLDGPEYIGTGYSITVPRTSYVDVVQCEWTQRDNAYILNNSGAYLTDNSGNRLTYWTEI